MYKVGIIGTGHLREVHIKNWLQIAQVSLAGFYDPGTDNVPAQGTDQNLRSYASLDELIDACDIIDIVVTATQRFAACEKAIRKGKHVLVAMPMGFSMTEADQLVKLVQESSVKLQVAHTERFNPAYESLKGLRLKPVYIEGQHVVPFGVDGKGPHPIFDLLIQDIDTVLSLVESEVKNIAANGVSVLNMASDLVNARIEFNNGCVASLTASRVAPKAQFTLRLFQKNVITNVDFLNKHTHVIRSPFQEEQLQVQGPLSNGQTLETDSLQKEMEAFVACIRNNTRPVVNEIDGYRAMEVVHQILKKINSNLSTAH